MPRSPLQITLLFFFLVGANAQTTLIPVGTSWKYLADGTDAGGAWFDPAFDDSSWSNGVAKLGFGGAGEATVIGDGTNGHTAFYFRKSFEVTNASAFQNLQLGMMVDDGAVVYLNGVEVLRHNLPGDNINFQTLALVDVSGAAETNFIINVISSAMLVNGANILAAEVHQSAPNSSDLGWEIGLVGVPPAPPSITQNPTNQTVVAGQSATFTVVATGSAPLIYEWQKDFAAIPGATNSVYALQNVSPSDGGDYFCVVGNSSGSVTSSVVTLTVLADGTPPHLVTATGDASFTTVKILFDEPLELTSASEPFNYFIDGGLDVTGAVLQPDGRSVLLTTTSQAQGTIYTVTINGVTDLALNPIAGDSTVQFQSFVFSPGFVLFEAYNTGAGSAVSNLTSHPAFPNNPDERRFMTSFDTRTVYPDDSHENYGARMTGLFVPPASGNYIFFLKSADAAELHLNPAGIDAAGAILMAEETACCGLFSDHASAPQSLIAGQRYFIMALFKAGTGSDYCQVAVKLDTDPTDPDTLPPISGGSLGVFADSTCAAIVITQQPVNTTTTECMEACFSVTAAGLAVTNCAGTGTNAPVSYQWQSDSGSGFTNIPGANSATLCIPARFADNGLPFRAIVSVPGATAISQSALLTVSPDTAPPRLVSVSPNCTNNTVLVDFSERINPGPAQDVANYSIPGVVITMATLNADGQSVTVGTGSLMPDTAYTLTVSGLTDLCAGELISPNPSQMSFECKTPLLIDVPPIGQTLAPGDTATFTVQASGPSPLRYAWYKDSFFIAGATNATFVISDAQISDVARYSVRVSTSNGTVISQPAELAMLDSYSLDLPAGYSLIANQLHGSNNTLAALFPSPPAGTVLYKFVPGAGYAISTFDDIALMWVPDPNLTLHPGEGAVIFLPVPASFTFQGEFRPPVLPIALTEGYNLVSRQIPRPGTYEDIVGLPPAEGAVVDQLDPALQEYRTHTFVAGEWLDGAPLARVGEALWISRITLPTILEQPLALTNVVPGSNLNFIVVADGSAPLRYQWRRNGVSIPDATNDTYSIPNAQLTDAGIYSVAVQASRVTPGLGPQPGKAEDVMGAVASLPVPLTFNLTNFPFSDAFSARPNVSTSDGRLAGDNTGASLENGEPRHAGKPGGHSVWLTWIAPTDGIVTFSTAGSVFDTVLAAYEGTDFSGPEVASNDDGEPFLGSRISFNAMMGQRYNIVLDGFGRAAGGFQLAWNLEETTERLPVINVQPRNQVVDLNGTAQFTVVAPGANLTYQWLLDGQPISGASQSNYLINAVQDTNSGTYAVVVSNPDRSIVSHAALLQIQPQGPAAVAKAGGEDLLALDKFEDIVTAATNSAFPFPKPGSGRVVAHGFSGTQIFSTLYSSKQAGEPEHCGVRGGASEWFAYQPTNSGTIIINTDGSNFDTVLAVYVGPGTDFNTLTNVACDNNSGTNGRTSRVSFAAQSNTIYWIAVDGVNDPITGRPAKGNVHLNYRLLLPLTLSSLSLAPGLDNGRVIFRVNGTPNVAATVQGATNLAAPIWISLLTNTPVNGTFLFTNTDALVFTNRLYRAIHRF